MSLKERARLRTATVVTSRGVWPRTPPCPLQAILTRIGTRLSGNEIYYTMSFTSNVKEFVQ
jgi:hypothetical protein